MTVWLGSRLSRPLQCILPWVHFLGPETRTGRAAFHHTGPVLPQGIGLHVKGSRGKLLCGFCQQTRHRREALPSEQEEGALQEVPLLQALGQPAVSGAAGDLEWRDRGVCGEGWQWVVVLSTLARHVHPCTSVSKPTRWHSC